MNRPTRITLLCLLLVSALSGARQAVEADWRINLDPPGPREFVLDKADILDPAAKAQIQQECDKLLSERATPIIVVTIKSMADCGAAGLKIETFARLLFDQWQIGIANLGNENWNTGILLVVSTGDRKARIELGAGWRRDNDAVCEKIMDQYIVPRFKQGDYTGGIAAGVKALDDMARGKTLPAPPAAPRPWWHTALVFGFIGLAIFTIVSLARRGASGWAWLFWAGAFSLTGYLLYSFLSSSSNSSGGGGFSGGSFGGGSSGGGGASGSW